MASSGWQRLQALKARNPRCNPVCIGKSIWISTDYNDGERGLVEFHCPSRSITHTAKYPNGFEPMDHSMTGSVVHGIVLVDGVKGKLITFDPVGKKYGATVTIPKLGDGTSSLMIKGNVHIIHGSDNSKNQYLIYSMKTGKVTKFKDNLNSPPMNGVSFTKRQDDSRFYKFGGYNLNGKKYVNSFHSGALQNGDAAKPIIWKKVPGFTLKNGNEVRGFGTLQCGAFILTFGGKYQRNVLGDVTYVRDIHILDLQSSSGWIKSKITCSMKSSFIAVLDHQHRVHLLTRYRDSNHHYSNAMKDLVPEFVVPQTTQRVTLMKKRQIQNHLDDEKERIQVASSVNSANLKDENATLKALNRSLEDEVERLKKTNSNLTELQKGLESDNMRLKAENGRTKVMNESLREEVETSKKTNGDLSQKQKRLESDVMRLNAESKKLSDEVAVYQDEQKEAQRKIAELEDKVKDLETKALDPSKFMEWDYNQIHFWIMGLENGRFQQYDAVLKKALSEADLEGEDLLEVSPSFIKFWGIKDRKDREELNGYIQRLVKEHGTKEMENEGGVTQFV